ncbi:hypothetical protein GOD83_32925, partial [Sinorhizobium medicae]|nr:hypothetical protein [Sinorhizobium medicae]MDX0581236.1 hypothetical protein [Sinorhizobium medicae]MDX0784843.1 hypothetical protein [Sinorhizobium medicae]
MKNVHNTIDEARLGIMLNELRLPTIKTLWRIASPELLPENGLLPHLNCSRRINL